MSATTLSDASRRELPILRPGDLAWWAPTNSTISVPVTVLGYGEYVSAFGHIVEGVTVRANASRSDRYRSIERGDLVAVIADDVCPRSLRVWHPTGRYYYSRGTWSFDLTCAVHDAVHSCPSYVCR